MLGIFKISGGGIYPDIHPPGYAPGHFGLKIDLLASKITELWAWKVVKLQTSITQLFLKLEGKILNQNDRLAA